MDEKNLEPKISLVEAVYIVPALLTLEILSIFLPVVGGWILNLLVSPLLILYYSMKGVSVVAGVVAFILEFIPVINFLPLITIGFLFVFIIDRLPFLRATVEEVGKFVPAPQKLAGGAVAGRAGAAAGEGARAGAKVEEAAREKGAPPQRPAIRGGREAETLGVAPLEAREGELARGGVGEREAFEKLEVEGFGMRPELLSKYELERTFTPPEVNDIRPPNKKKG